MLLKLYHKISHWYYTWKAKKLLKSFSKHEIEDLTNEVESRRSCAGFDDLPEEDKERIYQTIEQVTRELEATIAQVNDRIERMEKW